MPPTPFSRWQRSRRDVVAHGRPGPPLSAAGGAPAASNSSHDPSGPRDASGPRDSGPRNSGLGDDVALETVVERARAGDVSAFEQVAAAYAPSLLRFTAAEGAGDHCEMRNRTLLDQRVFDWLDDALSTARP